MEQNNQNICREQIDIAGDELIKLNTTNNNIVETVMSCITREDKCNNRMKKCYKKLAKCRGNKVSNSTQT